MKKLLLAAVAFTAWLAQPLGAHRLDEYLQATMLSVSSSRVDATVRLVPGVSVAARVIKDIGVNSDGAFSDVEQRAYAQRVVADLTLRVDDVPATLHLASIRFPNADQLRQGTGEIVIAFWAEMPAGRDKRRLVFENNHQTAISVYLVNALVPEDPHIHLGEQSRSETQAVYRMDFMQDAGTPSAANSHTLSGFGSALTMGVRHTAEGTDHLLFLLTLLLPAPLLAVAGRWSLRASIRQSSVHIFRIVTAFTLGHSLTLALATFSPLPIPGAPVELLIAVSIMVTAMHAIRPLLPGREDLIAGGFGLIHGMAFASTLQELGTTGWYRLVTLAGFNLGLETMQLAVVAAVLPSLLLLSRTRAYSLLRIGGGALALGTALVWLYERTTGVPFAVLDDWLSIIARRAPAAAVALFVISTLLWLNQFRSPQHATA